MDPSNSNGLSDRVRSTAMRTSASEWVKEDEPIGVRTAAIADRSSMRWECGVRPPPVEAPVALNGSVLLKGSRFGSVPSDCTHST